MKIKHQHSEDMGRLARLVQDIPVAMLTSVDEQGRLLSRPMRPLEMDAQGALWFFVDLQSAQLSHLQALNLSFSDPRHASYVSLTGHGEVLMDRERIEYLWSSAARTWFPDGPASKSLALLRFLPAAAEYWDAPGSRMGRLVALAVSAVIGRPRGPGAPVSLSGLAGQMSAASHREAL